MSWPNYNPCKIKFSSLSLKCFSLQGWQCGFEMSLPLQGWQFGWVHNGIYKGPNVAMMSRHHCIHTDQSTHSCLRCTEDPVERWTCSSHVCLEKPAVENSQPQPHLRHSSGKSCSKLSGIWTHQAGIKRNQSAVILTCYFTHDLKSGMSLPPNMFCSKGYRRDCHKSKKGV